jgi:hypothetical protein
MALSKNLSINAYGTTITIENAYAKVIGINGNKQSIEVKYAFFTKADGEFVKSGSSVFVPFLNGNNFIAQAYEHLKTLPEFADATDC